MIFARRAFALFCAAVVLPGLAATSAHAGEMLEMAQKRMADLGYYAGPFDGKMNGATGSALRGFQMANGLPAAGMLDANTNNLLIRLDCQMHNGAAAGQTAYYNINALPVRGEPANSSSAEIAVAAAAASQSHNTYAARPAAPKSVAYYYSASPSYSDGVWHYLQP